MTDIALASVNFNKPFFGPAVPVNHFTEKRNNGRYTQYIINGGPKYYKSGKKFLPINTSIVPLKDSYWNFGVEAGIYKLKVKDDAEFEFLHDGHVLSQKVKSVCLFDTKTCGYVEIFNFELSNPEITGNTITWEHESGLIYKLIYEENKFRDVIVVPDNIRQELLESIDDIDTENLNFGVLYDIDFSKSGIINDFDFNTTEKTVFGNNKKIKHFVYEADVMHSLLYESKTSIEADKYNDLKWNKQRFHKDGVYIESIPVEALSSPAGSIIFNTTTWFQQGSESYTGCENCYVASSISNAQATDTMYFKNGYSNLLGFDVTAIPNTDNVIYAAVYLQCYESYVTADVNFGKINDPDSRGLFVDYDSSTSGVTDPTGASTWDYVQHNTVRWSGASGNFSTVKDTSFGSFSVTAGQAGYGQFEVRIDSNQHPDLLTLAQGWVDGTIPIRGMWFQDDNTTDLRARSKFYGTVADRPKLEIIVWNADFTDDFESGNLNGFDSIIESGGTVTIDSSTPIDGTYSLKSAITGGSSSQSIAAVGQHVNFTELFLKFDIRLNTGFTVTYPYVNLVAFLDIDGDVTHIFSIGSDLKVGVWNAATNTYTPYNTPLSVGTTYNVELYIKIDNVAGVISLKSGGTEIIRFDGDTLFNYATIAHAYIGLNSPAGQVAASVDYDNILLADAIVASSGSDSKVLTTRVTVLKKTLTSLITRVTNLKKTTKTLTTRITVFGKSTKVLSTRSTVRRYGSKML